ncbi:MAG: cephalosporin hydroxylase family protein, partial [Deltaproteobacteria bacterium]|nr:cephalosporin hydroxylase family protein [Deltaproteobacteria bacterium]
RMHMLECDSLSETAQQTARKEAERGGPVMVVLDSCHSHAHVLAELELYSKFVTPESYLVVFDGIVEFFPAEAVFPGRPWGAGDNPLTATQAFLQNHPEFEVDTELENKLQITAAPKGWLKRLPDHR